ncbi:DNA recombination protein RmuC [Kushneria aurantia]|uniref:DNA recombination protein RmuC n=1 Tax=Kushneria aurantia TaxID=504092 RepID=A0ABV6G8H0_9GAMM|nr:DNA recombination protein RmuC [Kushneria aurantia]
MDSLSLPPMAVTTLIMTAVMVLGTAALCWRVLRRRDTRLAALQETLEEAREQQVETERLLAEREALLERERAHGQQQRQQLDERERRLTTLGAELADYRERCTRLEVERQKDSAHFEERMATLVSAREELTREFERLAGRIFDERQQQFAQYSRDSIAGLTAPLREQIEQFRARIETLHGEQQRGHTQLAGQLDQLAGLNRQMSEDASNLTRALKGDSKARGNWGELILERVLERSGLRAGIEYAREVSLENDEGGRLRPDAVIYLPEKRHLIVDAKVSLNAWSEVVAATDDAVRHAAMQRHLRSVRGHIESLAAKEYPRLAGMNAPDMVFLFMPVEPAFAAVFEHDDRLFHDAFDRRVVLVTPTTLLASLRTVAGLWRLERHNDNAREIVSRAEKLLEKCQNFVASMDDVGTHLTRAGNSHRQAMDRLRDGQGSLIAQAGRLNALGARNRRDWPSSVVEAAEQGREAEQREADQPRREDD